jgi:hypothetical protein
VISSCGLKGDDCGLKGDGCGLKGEFFLRTEGRFLLVFLALWFLI